ncbi:MAG TPA: hypothetical protein VM491_23135, partial [Burkholderiaceae bacterium]|nr:hypothetical protein [Burkholderiaceae bacterium]
MSKIRDITFIAAMAVGAAFAPTALAHGDGHLIVFPDQLQWTDVPTLPPGAKMARIEGNPSEAKPFVARLKFPPGYRVPPHMHP